MKIGPAPAALYRGVVSDCDSVTNKPTGQIWLPTNGLREGACVGGTGIP